MNTIKKKSFLAIKFLKLILITGLSIIIILEGLIIYSSRNNFSPDADYIIVLGAKLHGKRPSKSLLYRMNTALAYMKKYPNMKLIASGGQGFDESIPEAVAIKNYFIENGIKADRILLEDKSKNTFENMKFSRKLIKKNGLIKINVVTNRYHILRSKLLAERNNFKAYGLPAKTPKSVLLKSYLRESLALVKSFFLDR